MQNKLVINWKGSSNGLGADCRIRIYWNPVLILLQPNENLQTLLIAGYRTLYDLSIIFAKCAISHIVKTAEKMHYEINEKRNA